MAKTSSAKAIDIASVQRTRKTIVIFWRQGDGKFDLDERDNPLPSFAQAFDALTPLVATILHLPAAWAAENLRVIGLIMSEQGGAPTVQLVCRKSLSDASKEFPFKTPPRLLAHPTEEGSYTPPLTAADAELVQEAIEQAKLYVRGDRAQGQIAFEEEDEEDDGSGAEPAQGDELKFPEPAAPEAKPAKKRGTKRTNRSAAK